MGSSVAWLLWMTLRPNPQVAAQLTGSAALLQQVGVSPAWGIEMLGNVLVFVPCGVALALLQPLSSVRGARLWRTALCGAALSASIELLQHLTATRVPSWRDVLLNTLGVLLGALGGECMAGLLPRK